MVVAAAAAAVVIVKGNHRVYIDRCHFYALRSPIFRLDFSFFCFSLESRAVFRPVCSLLSIASYVESDSVGRHMLHVCSHATQSIIATGNVKVNNSENNKAISFK